MRPKVLSSYSVSPTLVSTVPYEIFIGKLPTPQAGTVSTDVVSLKGSKVRLPA